MSQVDRDYEKVYYKETERLFDRAIDRKERLIQTYIVISGLLVASYPQLSINDMSLFYIFLVSIIMYYAELSKLGLHQVISNMLHVLYLNALGVIASSAFSLQVCEVALKVSKISNMFNDKDSFVWIIILIAAVERSLWFNYPEFTPKKGDILKN